MLGLGHTETSVGTSLSLEKCGKADSVCKWDKLVSTEICMRISTEFTPEHLPVPLRVYAAFMTNSFLDPELLWVAEGLPPDTRLSNAAGAARHRAGSFSQPNWKNPCQLAVRSILSRKWKWHNLAYGEYLLAGLSFANNMLRNLRNGICFHKKGFQKFRLVLVWVFVFCCKGRVETLVEHLGEENLTVVGENVMCQWETSRTLRICFSVQYADLGGYIFKEPWGSFTRATVLCL